MERRVDFSSESRRPSIMRPVRSRDRPFREDFAYTRLKVYLSIRTDSYQYQLRPACCFPGYSRRGLPSTTDLCTDAYGRQYYVDHAARATSWDGPFRPMDQDVRAAIAQSLNDLMLNPNVTLCSDTSVQGVMTYGLSFILQRGHVYWPDCVDHHGRNPPIVSQLRAALSPRQQLATNCVRAVLTRLAGQELPEIPSGSGLLPYNPDELPAYRPRFNERIHRDRVWIGLCISEDQYRLRPAHFFPTYLSGPLPEGYERRDSPSGIAYFLNHENRTSSWHRPPADIPLEAREYVENCLQDDSLLFHSDSHPLNGREWRYFSIYYYVVENRFLIPGGLNRVHFERADRSPNECGFEGLNPGRFEREADNFSRSARSKFIRLLESLTGSRESPLIPEHGLPILDPPSYTERNQPRSSSDEESSSSRRQSLAESFDTLTINESSLATLSASEAGDAPMEIDQPRQEPIGELPQERRRRLDRERQARRRERQADQAAWQEYRPAESDEERDRRLLRERVARHRDNMDAQEREEHLQRRREIRASQEEAIQIQNRAIEAEMRREHRANASQEFAEREREENRRQHAEARRRQPFFGIGFEYGEEFDLARIEALISIGLMSGICSKCSARRFRGEPSGFCCLDGKIRVPIVMAPPPEFAVYYTRDIPAHKEFMDRIRVYNSRFSMTSLRVNRAPDLRGNWNPSFRIQGQIYSRVGTLEQSAGAEPRFLQIYFLGAEDQIEHRMRENQEDPADRQRHPPLNRALIRYLTSFLNDNNRLIREFKAAKDRLDVIGEERVILQSNRVEEGPLPAGAHRGQYNAPTGDETSILIVTPDRNCTSRQILLHRRDSSIQRINEMHPSYDALQYPLIFWRGNETHTFSSIRHLNADGTPSATKFVTTREYYCFILQVRLDDGDNFIFRCGNLLNQFVVDMWAKAESERLRFLRLHQDDLRSADYIDLRDALNEDGDLENLGRRVILPSTFIGGPRHMQEYTQDALAIVREFGRPSLFITMTCNGQWEEITRELYTSQPQTERHDIISRVFEQKVKKLIKLLTKEAIFGTSRGYVYSIEWQKRGLPHVHLLLWLEQVMRPSEIDEAISAEIPDPNSDPVLYELVTRHMRHGPCGSINPNSPCMEARTAGAAPSCRFKFPREFTAHTVTYEDGYPLYRRRRPEDGGQTYTIQVNRQNFEVTNQWIVPHSPLLLRLFKCHINVEFCHSVKAIKYLFKYIHKGEDMSRFGTARVVRDENGNEIPNNDEISHYETGRYLSASEAFWKFYRFSIHARDPPIQHLEVHLENFQRAYFRPGQEEPIQPRRTTLTSFFELCAANPAGTANLLYIDTPKHYTYSKQRGFAPRRQHHVFQIGRIYTVHPNVGECYFLRLLLVNVKGPRGFEDIKKVNGVQCETFREACRLLGLLDDDGDLYEAMRESIAARMPASCRHLFAIILTQCNPGDPMHMWLQFRDDLCVDIAREPNVAPENVFNECLIRIEDLTIRMANKTFGPAPNQIPLPVTNRANQERSNPEIRRERNYNREDQAQFAEAREAEMTPEQRQIFETIIGAIDRQAGGVYFIDAPGGTGKTFLLNAILAKVRSEDKIVLACASTGIAATLLEGGRTAHSTFAIPIHHSPVPICSIERRDHRAELCEQAAAIIWDECTMSNRNDIEAVDRTLKDLRRNDDTFGGVVMLFAGDFRQTLPVVQHGTPADMIAACIKFSTIWPRVQRLSLTLNIRVHRTGDVDGAAFSSYLLRLGDGQLPCTQDMRILVDNRLCVEVPDFERLIDAIFPNLEQNVGNPVWLWERAILAPLNIDVDAMNLCIQDRLGQRQSRTYHSVDWVVNPGQAVDYPPEVLNGFEMSGFPKHTLELKVGSPIILLRNLDPPELVNGTRLRITSLRPNSIEAVILTERFRGKVVFIPRIKLFSDDQFVVHFARKQFPVRLAFAMTINKSQGQTLKVAGINLMGSQCFSHGQLYVACSRVGTRTNLYILTEHHKAKNIVFQEVYR